MSVSTRRANWRGMNWIRQEKRLAIYARDNFACVYCKRGIESDNVTLSLDHIVPVSQSGTNDATNLVTACMQCNVARGDKNIATFAKERGADLEYIFDRAGARLDIIAAKAMLAARKKGANS